MRKDGSNRDKKPDPAKTTTYEWEHKEPERRLHWKDKPWPDREEKPKDTDRE